MALAARSTSGVSSCNRAESTVKRMRSTLNALRPDGPDIIKPRATPWVCANVDSALKGQPTLQRYGDGEVTVAMDHP